MRLTSQQLQNLLNQTPQLAPINAKVARVHVVGQMNKTETAYSEFLDNEKLAGRILRWDFEPEKLKLAAKTFYTPDFRIIRPDKTIEFHECKGFWEDDARVKIKVAAVMHPYKFFSIKRQSKKQGGGWIATQI